MRATFAGAQFNQRQDSAQKTHWPYAAVCAVQALVLGWWLWGRAS